MTRYTEEDIQVLDDAVGLVRRRPSMFLAVGVTLENIAEALAHDALVLGAKRIVVERQSEWMVVGADVDWLREPGRFGALPPLAELFRRIVPLLEDGPNGMRHEILAAAYAKDVVTATSADRLLVAGVVEDDAAIWSALCRDHLSRSVAIRGLLPLPVGGG
jgi:hypothetical protein